MQSDSHSLSDMMKEEEEEEEEDGDLLFLQSVHVLFLLPATLLSRNLQQRGRKQRNALRDRGTKFEDL